MKFVIVESPFAGDVERNVRYARRALRDCLERGEAPFASHLLYTQPGVLDDGLIDERERGISAGLELAKRADASVFYVDHGMSSGMLRGLAAAHEAGREIEQRSIGVEPNLAPWWRRAVCASWGHDWATKPRAGVIPPKAECARCGRVERLFS